MERGAWQAVVHGVTKSRTRPTEQQITTVTVHAAAIFLELKLS